MVGLKVWSVVFIGLKTMEGDRAYIADFGVYDQRAIVPANTNLDIY